MFTEILIKYAAEATLVSTALAGVRRGMGYDLGRLMMNRLPEGTPRNLGNKYLDLGEYCFEKGQNFFKKAVESGNKQGVIESAEAATKNAADKASKQ